MTSTSQRPSLDEQEAAARKRGTWLWWGLAALLLMAVGLISAGLLSQESGAGADTAASTAAPQVAGASQSTGSELVTTLLAALNDRDAEAVMALHWADATHGFYFTDGVDGDVTALWDLEELGAVVADPEYDSIELVGEPMMWGSMVAVPVRYSYPSEGPYLGFDLLLLDESSSRIRHGVTLLAVPDLTTDQSVTDALRRILGSPRGGLMGVNGFAVIPHLSSDAELWLMSVGGLERWSVPEYDEFMNPWADQSDKSATPLVESGPFVATATQRGWDDRGTWVKGMTIYEARNWTTRDPETQIALVLHAVGAP